MRNEDFKKNGNSRVKEVLNKKKKEFKIITQDCIRRIQAPPSLNLSRPRR